MYNTSDEYKQLIRDGKTQGSKLYGTITTTKGLIIKLDENNLKQGSTSISLKSCSGSKLEIGTAIKGQLTTSFFYDIKNQYELINAKVVLYFQLADDIIPLGIYNVASTSRNANCIKLTCYDNMSLIDRTIGNVNTNGTVYDVLNWVCKKTDIELANTREEIESMTNGTNIINVGVGVYSSYIDVVKDIAGLLAGFATIDRSGRLEIRNYKTESVFLISPSERFQTKLSDFECYITELVSNINSQTYTVVTGDGSGLTYKYSTKCVSGTESVINSTLRNILNKLAIIKYVPCEIQTISDPSLDIGDLVTLESDGRTVKQSTNTLITSITFVNKSKTTLKSSGENPYLASSESSSSSASSSYAAQSKNNSTYISTYENAKSYTINSSENIVSSIDYTCGENDILVCSGQCVINVTCAGTANINYYQDGTANSFFGEQYLTTGKHIIPFSCWFKADDTNKLINISITINSKDGLTGNIDIDKVNTYVLGTCLSDGKFVTNNVLTDNIPIVRWNNNIYPAGYVKEEDK